MNNRIYLNNNNLLIGITNDLQQIIYNTHDNLIIQRIGNIINKMNFIINENKKNTELIRNDINKLYKQMNKQFEKLNINNKTEINYNNNDKRGRAKYIGEILNRVPNGKGIMYWNDGVRHED